MSQLSVRDITPYEKEKWFDKYNRFGMDEASFMMYGDELGEAFDQALAVANNAELSDDFVEHATVVCLDMYYDQMLEVYDERSYCDEPEELGLPTLGLFKEKAKELGVTRLSDYSSPDRTDTERNLWDWAIEWRETHKDETRRAEQIAAAKATLARLEG